MTYVLGLTGSIGMGKSTTADFFRKHGVPVWDADAVVHQLYSTDHRAIEGIARIIPDSIKNGTVDRIELRKSLKDQPDLLSKIEQVIHPLVSENRQDFIQNTDSPLVVCDIPLLFETKADVWLDGVLVVSAPADIQRDRVLSRPEMTEDLFQMILSKQVPDAEKRKRADFVIETISLAETEDAVRSLIDMLKAKHA